MIGNSTLAGMAGRAARRATLALLALVVVAAAADPSGLLALVPWQGSQPVAALWWWAPYLVYLPVLLALNHLGVRSLLRATLRGTARGRLFLALWGIAVLAATAASALCALAIVAREILAGRMVLPGPSALALALWSSGYAALKMLLVGWLPAAAGAWAWQPRRLPDTSGRPNAERAPHAARVRLAALIAGGGVFALALLGPWLARHWWQGSPVGYIYAAQRLFAPSPAGGVWMDLAALLACGITAYLTAVRALAGLCGRAPAAALFCVGALSALAGAACLLIVQTLLALWAGAGPAATRDLWILPATYLRSVEAGSFALLAALPMGLLASVCGRVLAAAARREGAPHSPRAARGGALLAAAALVPCLLGVRVISGAEPPAAPPVGVITEGTAAAAELPRLLVREDAQGVRIADGNGAQVTLRGINVNQLNAYYLADSRLADVVPLSEQDFADIAALGLNSVRLTLSWSRLEPRRGEFSQAYLAQVHQAVDWARSHRLYVILDMHQDAWGASVVAPSETRCRPGTSPMTGWDGAPAWATHADGRPPCQITGRDLAPNVARAFQSFYFDRDGIESELIRAWAMLAGSFAADTAVAGYDLLNEPNFAESPPLSSTLMLANYHARCIRALRAAEAAAPRGFAHLVFLEPSILWSGFGVDNLPPRDFTADRQIVFSPHLYNESITVDQDLGANLISIERGFALAQAGAAQLHAPLWIGEWGFFGDPQAQAPLRSRQAQAEDSVQAGSAVWVWKQACGDPHVYPGRIAGNLRRRSCPDDQELATLPPATAELRRAYPRAAPGRILTLRAQSGRLELAGAREGAPQSAAACALEIWFPGEAQPLIGASAGIADLNARRVAPGTPLMGPSGGWLLSGCVTASAYHLTVQS
jgi:hypothetical protein